MKKIFGILAVAALLFFLRGLLLGVPVYVWGRSHGFHVFISPLSSFDTRHITLRSVRMLDERRRLFFKAGRIDMDVDLPTLLQGKVTSSMLKISLQTPRLIIRRDKEGRWSPKLPVESSSLLKDVSTDIIFGQGEITVRDARDAPGNTERTFKLSPVNGIIDFEPARITVDANVRAGSQGTVRLRGGLLHESLSGILTVDAKKVPLPIFSDWWPGQNLVRVVSGVGDGSATVWIAYFRIPSWKAQLQIRDVSLANPKNASLRFNHLGCAISVEKSVVHVDRIEGSYGKSSAKGSAVITLGKIPQVLASMEIPSFPLRDLEIPLSGSRDSPGGTVPGTGRLRLTLLGEGEHSRINASLETPEGKNLGHLTAFVHHMKNEDVIGGQGAMRNAILFGTPVTYVGGRFLAAQNSAWVNQLRTALPNGALGGDLLWHGGKTPRLAGELSGSIEHHAFHPIFFGRSDDLFLADASGFLHARLPGGVSGVLDVSEFPLAFDSNPASVKSRASGLFVFQEEKGKPFSGLGYGRLAKSEATVQVPLRVTSPSEMLPDAEWTLSVNQNRGGVTLTSPKLTAYGHETPAKSQVAFAGESSGAPESLFFAGTLDQNKNKMRFESSLLGKGKGFGKPFAFSADLGRAEDTLHINRLQGAWDDSLYDLKGFFGRALDISGTVTRADVSDFARIFPNTPSWLSSVSGKLTGSFRASGPRSSLSGNIRGTLDDGSAFGQPISTAYLSATMNSSVLRFNPIVARSSKNYLFAKGTIGLNGMAHLSFEVPELDLSQIPALKPKERNLSGGLSMTGTINGPVWSPDVKTRMSIHNFGAWNLHVEKINADLSYLNKTFGIRNAVISNGNGSAHGDARIALGRSPRLQTDLGFSEFDLPSLVHWNGAGALGTLDGFIALDGPLADLTGRFDLRTHAHGQETGAAAGSVNNGIASFQALKFSIGGGEISGHGNLDVKKPSTLEIEGKSLDVAALAKLFGRPESLQGKASFHGEIRTSIQNPEMDLNVNIANPKFGALSASSIQGKVVYKNGKMFLADAEAVEPHGVLKLEGFIPIKLGKTQTIRSPFALRLRLENQDLKLLNDLFPLLDAAGKANADLRVSFAPDHYAAGGTLALQNGTLRLPDLMTPLESLEGTFNLKNNNLSFLTQGKLTRPFSADGHFQLSGNYGGNLFSTGEIHVSGDKLSVQIPNADLVVTPDLRLATTGESWKLAGTAAVESGDINTDLFTSRVGRALFPKPDELSLDTTLHLSDQVRFHHPHLAAQGGGTLFIGGTAAHPQVTGEVTGDKGTLNFLGRDFILRRGSATFSPDHRLPYLSLAGVAVRRVAGSLLFIHLTGYPGDLHLDLTSDPPLTQNELAMTFSQSPERYMAGGSNQFLQQEASHWLNTGIESEIFYPVENVFGSALSLEYFSFVFLPTGQLGLEVGKQISPHVAVTYSRAVGGRIQIQTQTDPGNVWGLEYRLSPQITLRATQDQLTGIGGQVLSKWNF